MWSECLLFQMFLLLLLTIGISWADLNNNRKMRSLWTIMLISCYNNDWPRFSVLKKRTKFTAGFPTRSLCDVCWFVCFVTSTREVYLFVFFLMFVCLVVCLLVNRIPQQLMDRLPLNLGKGSDIAQGGNHSI